MINTVWSSNGELENLYNLSNEEKRDYLADIFDQEMVSELNDDQLDEYISDNMDIYNDAAEDFEFNVAPKLAAQVRGGLILDDRFNFVDPARLLDFDGYKAELNDEDGILYFDVEGRKKFPVLGFSQDDNEFINQLDELGVLSTLRNIYPDKEDIEFDDIYYYGDLIPMDWDDLEKVMTKPRYEEEVHEDITEARTKDPKGLAKEVKQIRRIVNNAGGNFNVLTRLPFTSFDNDEISIEYNYPEFFKIVKAYWKEMELLDNKELKNTDALDAAWDSNIFQHDWDVIMRSCDKLINGKGVQFEKEYKTGYNSPLSDDEILAARERDNAEFNEAVSEKRFYRDGSKVIDGENGDHAIGDIYDDGTVELYGKLSAADRKKLKRDLRREVVVSFLDEAVDKEEDEINPELYKPFGHDSYDNGYIREIEPDDDQLDEELVSRVCDYVIFDDDGDYDLDTEEGIITNLKALGMPDGVKAEVLNIHGPAGGWPEIRFSGEKELVDNFLVDIGFDKDDIDSGLYDDYLQESTEVAKVGDEDDADRYYSANWYIGGKNNFELQTSDGRNGQPIYYASR